MLRQKGTGVGPSIKRMYATQPQQSTIASMQVGTTKDAEGTHHVHLLDLREHDVHAEPGLQRDHSLRGRGAR